MFSFWEYVDEYPVLACVAKALKLEESIFIRDGTRRMTDVLSNQRMDLEEYVRQYIYWVHGYNLNVLLAPIIHIAQNKNFIFYQPTNYIRQVLNITKECIIDDLDAYQRGMPVAILLNLNTMVKIKNCINMGIKIEDIYIIGRIEDWKRDSRKIELANLIAEYPRVVVYGTGNDFKYLIDNFSDKVVVCDKTITEDRVDNEIEYVTIDTLINKYREVAVYVTSTVYGMEIKNELVQKGFCRENIFLNKTRIGKVNVQLSKAEVMPLVKSKIWEFYKYE